MIHFKLVRLLLALLTAASLLNSPGMAAPLPPRHVQYVISFSSEGKTPCLNVTLTFAGSKSGTSQITLPSGLAPSGLYPNITDVRATSPETAIADTSKPQIKQLTYPPGQPVSVTYRVSVTDAGQQSDVSYSPEMERDHFSILGSQLLALPSGSAEMPLAVDMTWNSLPPGWTLANSYGIRQPHQVFTATPSTLQQSVWAAGDYRLLHTLIRGKSFYMAVRGQWASSDHQILAAFSRIIGAERQFWHDDSSAYYLVVLNSQDSGFVGISFPNSFYEAAPPELGLGFVTENTLAHEAFHAWLPHRIKLAAPLHAYDWLYEGFTVYYARLFQLRLGLISLAQYTDDCNKSIRDYASSPFRNTSGPQFRYALEHRVSDNRQLQLVYQQGDLLAQHWNAQIRLASHGRYSLDNAMLDLLHLAQAKHGPLPAADFVRVMRRYTGRDVSGDILSYTERGTTIPPDPAALGPYAQLLPTQVTLFDAGYNLRSSSQQDQIIGVEPASSAYQAGLREGQTYVDVKMSFGDATKKMHVTIKDQNGQRVISYYPVGKRVLIPQYKLRSTLPKASLSWFGIVQPSSYSSNKVIYKK